MTGIARALLLVFSAAAICGGCGSSSGSEATTTAAKPAHAKVSTVALESGVRMAIGANVRLSTYVLWHNRVPAWATQSTRGPALKALRNAAATRRKQGIQIKNLAGDYTVSAITLAPSYTTATATVRSHQRVAPYKAGHRLGKAIVGTDHAFVRLHRLGNTLRFVVWRVSPIQ